MSTGSQQNRKSGQKKQLSSRMDRNAASSLLDNNPRLILQPNGQNYTEARETQSPTNVQNIASNPKHSKPKAQHQAADLAHESQTFHQHQRRKRDQSYTNSAPRSSKNEPSSQQQQIQSEVTSPKKNLQQQLTAQMIANKISESISPPNFRELLLPQIMNNSKFPSFNATMSPQQIVNRLQGKGMYDHIPHSPESERLQFDFSSPQPTGQGSHQMANAQHQSILRTQQKRESLVDIIEKRKALEQQCKMGDSAQNDKPGITKYDRYDKDSVSRTKPGSKHGKRHQVIILKNQDGLHYKKRSNGNTSYTKTGANKHKTTANSRSGSSHGGSSLLRPQNPQKPQKSSMDNQETRSIFHNIKTNGANGILSGRSHMFSSQITSPVANRDFSQKKYNTSQNANISIKDVKVCNQSSASHNISNMNTNSHLQKLVNSPTNELLFQGAQLYNSQLGQSVEQKSSRNDMKVKDNKISSSSTQRQQQSKPFLAQRYEDKKAQEQKRNEELNSFIQVIEERMQQSVFSSADEHYNSQVKEIQKKNMGKYKVLHSDQGNITSQNFNQVIQNVTQQSERQSKQKRNQVITTLNSSPQKRQSPQADVDQPRVLNQTKGKKILITPNIIHQGFYQGSTSDRITHGKFSSNNRRIGRRAAASRTSNQNSPKEFMQGNTIGGDTIDKDKKSAGNGPELKIITIDEKSFDNHEGVIGRKMRVPNTNSSSGMYKQGITNHAPLILNSTGNSSVDSKLNDSSDKSNKTGGHQTCCGNLSVTPLQCIEIKFDDKNNNNVNKSVPYSSSQSTSGGLIKNMHATNIIEKNITIKKSNSKNLIGSGMLGQQNTMEKVIEGQMSNEILLKDFNSSNPTASVGHTLSMNSNAQQSALDQIQTEHVQSEEIVGTHSQTQSLSKLHQISTYSSFFKKKSDGSVHNVPGGVGMFKVMPNRQVSENMQSMYQKQQDTYCNVDYEMALSLEGDTEDFTNIKRREEEAKKDEMPIQSPKSMAGFGVKGFGYKQRGPYISSATAKFYPSTTSKIIMDQTIGTNESIQNQSQYVQPYGGQDLVNMLETMTMTQIKKKGRCNGAETRIEIIHNDTNIHLSQKQNIIFKSINQIIDLTWRNKDAPNYNTKAIQKICQTFGIKLPKQNYQLDNSLFKSKEFCQQVKEVMSRAILNQINHDNKILIHLVTTTSTNPNPQLQTQYVMNNQVVPQGNVGYSFKALIGRGNHGGFVKTILKSRSWWNVKTKCTNGGGQQFNFIWTQWYRRKYSNRLKKGTKLDADVSSDGSAYDDDEDEDDEAINAKVDDEPTAAAAATTQPQDTQRPQKSLTKQLQQHLQSQIIYNRLHKNYHLTNKKALFYNMMSYYSLIKKNPLQTIPLTFHIRNGVKDPEFERFKLFFQQQAIEIEQQRKVYIQKGINVESDDEDDEIEDEYDYGEETINDSNISQGLITSTISQANTTQDQPKRRAKHHPPISKNVWIVKPGENSNRGCGINVANSIPEIQQLVRLYGSSHTCIIQKYIERPLLIHRRKFDIRVFGLLTSINGFHKGYYFEDGYLRTASIEYNLHNLQHRYVHLTNDAVQKKSESYGKYESGNKISYQGFQKYLDQNYPDYNVILERDILSQIKQIMADSYRAVYGKIDPERRKHGFEIYGYDFMIDESFKVYLIEVNTNPCLETPCPLLSRIIAQLLDNAFKIAIDPLFPPPDFNKAMKDGVLQELKFELIFDEVVDGPELKKLYWEQSVQEEAYKIEADIKKGDITQEEEDQEEEEEEE